MVGVVEIGEGVVVRGTLHVHVVNLDLFLRRDVVINDHAFTADDGDFAYFFRVQPAALDRGGTLVRKIKIHRSHVFDAGRDMGGAAAIDAVGIFAHDIKDDRDVVRREIPRNIDVLLKESEIEAAGRDVANFPNV